MIRCLGNVGRKRSRRSSIHGEGLLAEADFFAGLETDGLPRRNRNFCSGAGVSADSALSGLDDKNTEAAQFDPLSPLHSLAESIKERIESHLSLDFGNPHSLSQTTDNIRLDHNRSKPPLSVGFKNTWLDLPCQEEGGFHVSGSEFRVPCSGFRVLCFLVGTAEGAPGR